MVTIHVIVILRVTVVMKKFKKPHQENTPKHQEDPDPVDCQENPVVLAAALQVHGGQEKQRRELLML